MKLWLLAVLVAVPTIRASPFDLSDKYVEDFAKGIENLRESAAHHQFQEGSFDHHNESEAVTEIEEFDFIVVGSGASGAVIANRLTEVPEWKVLLLEAGAPETPYTQIPSVTHVLPDTPYNWGYSTEPQDHACLGMIEHKCAVIRGKALGGSTALNTMIYARGNEIDYDSWADNGNDGWCYNDVLPYFKKSENANLHHFDRKYHNQGGPVNVEEPQHPSPFVESFLEAGHELGIKTVDYNGKEPIGFGTAQATTKHGRRNSVAQAYLKPASQRKNLSIKPLSQVIKILIGQHKKEATGVKYLHDGHLFTAKAHKEVIIAAGAINSPQLLMLSGIGPHEQLEKLEIPVHQDLRVGENLKDQLAFMGLNFVIDEKAIEEEPDHLVEWLREGKGPLAEIPIDALGFIKTQVSKDTTHDPDVELLLTQPLNHEAIKAHKIADEVYESHLKPIEGKAAFTVAVVQTHPKSTGVVKLKSKDPLNWPVIYGNYLSDPDDHDVATMLAGVHKVVELSKTEAFKKIGAHLDEHPIHGCETLEFGSDHYWKCAIRTLSISLRQQTGTCRMGKDKEAVVDHNLRVHGVHKLRVADESVVPVTISGEITAAAIMIGEKAADLIKHDWK